MKVRAVSTFLFADVVLSLQTGDSSRNWGGFAAQKKVVGMKVSTSEAMVL